MEDKTRLKEEILTLEKKIEDLKKRMPAHSVSVEMMQKLEDLEEEISLKKKKFDTSEKGEMS
jgi:hypothetical protein